MTLTISIPKPFINTSVVRRGFTAYILETGTSVGFNGYVNTITPTSVTLRGIFGTSGQETNLTVTADQLDIHNYQIFRFAEDMLAIKNQITDSWIEHVNVTVIDESIVQPTYFIMYRNNPTLPYTNGLIQNVSEDKMGVISVVSNIASRVTNLTVADITAVGFEAIVSDTIYGGISDGGGKIIIL